MSYFQAIRSPYDVTLAPAPVCCSSPSNLTGSYGISLDDCFRKNAIYQNNGSVCQDVMRHCVNPKTDAEQKRIDDFCGPSATPGFYRDGAFWSISH